VCSSDLLIKVKRNTGLEHWNEICRIALCRSLANPTIPPKLDKNCDSALDIEWKTFAGIYHQELMGLVYCRASKDKINVNQKEKVAEYFRRLMERGIASLLHIKNLNSLVETKLR
jgi:DNA sulfur modification protein DndE